MMVVAIDGVSGAGKSTLAKSLARELGLAHLDTGATYRALAWVALRQGISPSDEVGLEELLNKIHLDVGERVLVDGKDVTEELHTPEVDAIVSEVASHPGVRRRLVDFQRRWIEEHGGGVVEGRDIGTVVWPETPYKVFLVASSAERARRRAAQQGGDPEDLRPKLEARDEADSTRSASPLRMAEDAWVIDTTEAAPSELVERVARWIREQA